MNHMWNMLGLARMTAIPMIGSFEDADHESQSGEAAKQNERLQKEVQKFIQPSSKGQEKGDEQEAKDDAKKSPKVQHDIDQDGDDASLSSISFYDDFPELYFAVRKGRYVNNSVFLTWDSAREQIVDYPNAEYIATPTLEQAHNYTNGLGEFDNNNNIHEDQNDDSSQEMQLETSIPLVLSSKLPASFSNSSGKQPRKLFVQGKPKMVNPRNRKYTTRKLLLEYYEIYDPGYKAKDQDPLTIPQFLKEREMYETKFKLFTKHWQRSGLLMMCNEEKPLEEATYKYDSWVRERKLEKLGIELGDITCMNQPNTPSSSNNNNRSKNNDKGKKKRKRQRPVVMLAASAKDRNRNDGELNISTDSERQSQVGHSPDFSTKTNSPSKKRKRKSALPKKSVFKQTAANARPLNCNNESEDEEDDNDERFNAMYEKLKAFHSQHGHCKVTKSQNPELAYFVHYTRRRMRDMADRSGARALTLREEKLLNDLDFDPVYKEIVTEFNKYLGMRVAKLFDVVVDGKDKDDEEENGTLPIEKGVPRIKKVPFFGTVGRISSVCNRYLRIKYDDGDSEDFDLACLMDGLKLYNQYEHKDMLRGAKKVAPSTKPSETALANQNDDKSKPNECDKDGIREKSDNKNNNDKGNDNEIGNDNFAVVDSKENQATTPTKSILNDAEIKIPSTIEANNTSKPTTLGDDSNAIETTTTVELGKLPESTITPETNPTPHDSTEMRDSDHSSINNFPINANDNEDGDDNDHADDDAVEINSSTNENSGDNDKRNGNGDGNDSEGDSTSSDDVEVVGVFSPYRNNPSLLRITNTNAGGDRVMHSRENRDNGNNPFSVYEEGVFDF